MGMWGFYTGSQSPHSTHFCINHFSWLNTSPTFCRSHCAKLHGEHALQITLMIRSYTATFILIKLGLIPFALVFRPGRTPVPYVHMWTATNGWSKSHFQVPALQDDFRLKTAYSIVLPPFSIFLNPFNRMSVIEYSSEGKHTGCS